MGLWPIQDVERRLGPATALYEPAPFPLSSRAYPDFLPRCTGNDRVCGFHEGKPHEVRQRHQYQQEIREAEGSAVLRTFPGKM
jgi:hypothetical protein